MQSKKINITTVVVLVSVLVLVIVGTIWFSKSINDAHKVINNKETSKTKVVLVIGKHYVVENFTVNQDRIVSITLEGQQIPITVDFKNIIPKADYYCNIGTGSENTLNGTSVIQKKDSTNHIRLSPDLARAIKIELNK